MTVSQEVFLKVPKTEDTGYYREPASLVRGSPKFSDFKHRHSNSSNFFIRGSMDLILSVLESYTRALFKNNTLLRRRWLYSGEPISIMSVCLCVCVRVCPDHRSSVINESEYAPHIGN